MIYAIFGELLKLRNDGKTPSWEGTEAMLHFDAGIEYRNSGQKDKAISEFTKAIELDPKDGKLYSKRVHFYYLINKYGEAVNDYSKAVQYDPENTENYYWRGNIYIEVGSYEPAILDFTKLIEILLIDSGAYNSRAPAYKNQAVRQGSLRLQQSD